MNQQHTAPTPLPHGRWELSRVVQLPLLLTVLILGTGGVWRLADFNAQFISNSERYIERFVHIEAGLTQAEHERTALRTAILELSVADAKTDQRLANMEASLIRIERWLERLSTSGVGGPSGPPTP